MCFLPRTLIFGHGNIIKYCDRPFLTEQDRQVKESVSPQEWAKYRVSWGAIKLMDDTIINNINATVGENDTLWILGDFAYGLGRNRIFEQCRAYRERIKCKNVHLVWGNHDRREISSLFSSCHDVYSLSVYGLKHRIVMFHYAMAIWDKSHSGSIHLYGHSHGGAEEGLNKMMPNRRSIDVGIDHAGKMFGEFRPFSLDEILQIMEPKSYGRVH